MQRSPPGRTSPRRPSSSGRPSRRRLLPRIFTPRGELPFAAIRRGLRACRHGGPASCPRTSAARAGVRGRPRPDPVEAGDGRVASFVRVPRAEARRARRSTRRRRPRLGASPVADAAARVDVGRVWLVVALEREWTCARSARHDACPSCRPSRDGRSHGLARPRRMARRPLVRAVAGVAEIPSAAAATRPWRRTSRRRVARRDRPRVDREPGARGRPRRARCASRSRRRTRDRDRRPRRRRSSRERSRFERATDPSASVPRAARPARSARRTGSVRWS
jgi:hypothetical protein